MTARDQYVSVHFRIDTRSEAAGTFEQKVKTFANGTAKEYIRWKLAFANVIRLKPLETGMAKIVMADFRRLLAKISNKNRFLSQKYPTSSKSSKGLHMPRH